MEYPKLISKGLIKTYIVAHVNGYEIINEILPGYFNYWSVAENGKFIPVNNAGHISYPRFDTQAEAVQFALSIKK